MRGRRLGVDAKGCASTSTGHGNVTDRQLRDLVVQVATALRDWAEHIRLPQDIAA
jgi:hypothetical protein